MLNRIKPVGEVQLAVASGPKGQLTGEQVYNQVCKTCHEAGRRGRAEGRRQGRVGQDHRARTHPDASSTRSRASARCRPKGGNPDFENVEVERAVVYMANKAGANWKEPPPPAAAKGGRAHRRRSRRRRLRQVPSDRRGRRAEDRRSRGVDPARGEGARNSDASRTQGPRRHAGARRHGRALRQRDQARDRIHVQLRHRQGRRSPGRRPPRPPRPPPAAAAAAPAAAKPDGKKIYDTTCTVCHGAGVAGAPKFGDKAAWGPRLKTGIDALYASALKGKAAMPAKGGNVALADADVKAAVDYMVAAAK